MEAVLHTSTCRQLVRDAERRLAAAGIDTARLDAEVLLAWALGITRTALYAHLGEPVAPEREARFAAGLDRRSRREPVAYITGTHEFWSLPFAVDPAVLIPRPETERLVEIVCGLVAASVAPPHRDPLPQREGHGEGSRQTPAILDVGTGSGCIAVVLAVELPAVRVTAVDVAADAVAVARRNAAAHAVADRVDFAVSDLFDALPPDAAFDVIVSNPPYLAPGDVVSPELAFEPAAALAAGDDGLAVIRRLIAGAPARLRPHGWLVVEFGIGHDAVVPRLAHAAGLVDVVIQPDLAGIPRVLVARRG